MERTLYILVIILMMLTALPASAAPVFRLDTSITRSEFTAGDKFTVVSYLFNDGDTDADGTLSIVAPTGFKVIQDAPVTGVVPAQRALGANFSYEVLPTTPKGIYRFTVRANGLSASETIRVGPIEANPPRPPNALYFPLFRA